MAKAQTIAQWQQFLQTLAPVDGWLYIGAGRGEVLRETRFATVPRLLAVEADEYTSQLLAHNTAAFENWEALHALVNNTDGPATWYQLSREEESGLLPAEAISSLWPNLGDLHRAEYPAVSLGRLLEKTGENQEQYNWLTIDCLPAGRLLQGLNGFMEQLDMIEVRVAIAGVTLADTGATLEECDELLLPQGFTRLALEEAANPLVGRALYGRDFKLQLAEALKVYTELETQNNALIGQRNELRAENQSIQKECESLRSELQDQNGQNAQLREELQQAQQAALEHEGLYDTLTMQCDELKAINEVIQKERERMRHKLESLRGSESQLTEKLKQVQAELAEQQRTAQLSTKLLAKVEADASELRERYAENVKSEQELKDLIKELHAKLQAASHFYHKLEQEHPELLKKL